MTPTTQPPVYLVETTPATKPDNCPTCGDPANVFCSDGFHAPGKTYWPAEAPDAVERVARALAEMDGIKICSSALYAFSSYGSRARAAIAAMPGGGPGAWVPADHLAEANREIALLREALQLADAALSGANMNMNVVERKVKAALKEHADDPA